MLDYHRRYPNVKLSLITGHRADLVRALNEYELDGAFISGPLDYPDFDEIRAFDEELVLISEPTEALRDLLTKPRCSLARRYHRKRLEQWLHEEKVGPMNIMEFGTLEAIMGGVAAGLVSRANAFFR